MSPNNNLIKKTKWQRNRFTWRMSIWVVKIDATLIQVIIFIYCRVQLWTSSWKFFFLKSYGARVESQGNHPPETIQWSCITVCYLGVIHRIYLGVPFMCLKSWADIMRLFLRLLCLQLLFRNSSVTFQKNLCNHTFDRIWIVMVTKRKKKSHQGTVLSFYFMNFQQSLEAL